MTENSLSIQQAMDLAIKHHTAGDLSRAARLYKDVLGVVPKQPVALQLLGVIALQEGRHGEAADLIGRALELAPDYPEAHNNLGNVFRAQGKQEAAANCYRRAVAAQPDYVEAHNNLGLTLFAQRNFAEAIASYNTALAVNPSHAQVHYNLGNAYKALENFDAAIACYEKVLTLNPDHVPALNNLGNTLHAQGQLDDAVANYTQALKVDPENVGAHRNLSAAKTFDSSDVQISQMLALHAKDSLSESERMQICFALGKAFEDTGDYEKSFEFLHQANALRKAELQYDNSVDRQAFERIGEIFQHDLSGLSAPGLSEERKTPIFIVGMPRSGTTLVEQIISSHSEVFGGGELTMAEAAVRQSVLMTHPVTEDRLAAFRSAYLSGISGLGADHRFVTDKMPINFRWLGFILLALPEAKVIHITRDAMATCWSIYKHDFSSAGNDYAYDLIDIIEYYKLYRQLMETWRELFPGRICDVNYEYLTEHQEDETRKIISDIGLDWQDRCLDFHKNRRAVITSSALQVRQKIYTGSSSQWKNYNAFLASAFESLKAYQ